MIEKFSTPKKNTKKWGQREMKDGLEEFLSMPRGKRGKDVPYYEFDVTRTENPLKRKDIEREVENFVDQNLDVVLSIFLPDSIVNKISHNFKEKVYSDLIKKLNITNEHIGLLGLNYCIREVNDQLKILETDEYNPEGVEKPFYDLNTDAVILSLAYLKSNIRVDTIPKSGKFLFPQFPHRYYLKSQKRYLCANDFGMRMWSEEEGKMIDGDPTELSSYFQAVKSNFRRIIRNINMLKWSSMVSSTQLGKQDLLKKLDSNQKDRQLLLSADSLYKVLDYLYFHSSKIAKNYGFVSNNPVADYRNFTHNIGNLQKLFRTPSEQEKIGVTLNYVYFDFYKKPLIIPSDYHLNVNDLINTAGEGVRDFLANRAIQYENGDVRNCFEKYCSYRGQNSPYFYYNHHIYDLIKDIGISRTEQLLGNGGDHNISRQISGLEILRVIGYDIARMEMDQLKKQIHEVNKLKYSNLWQYLEKREQMDFRRIKKRRARDLFREGKRMYWLAQQVWRANPLRSEYDRFYYSHDSIDWSRYDLTKANVSEEKISEYLEKHANLIIALLGQEQEKEYHNKKTHQSTQATLGLIIQALERRQELRGVALANDKQRYLEGVIKEEIKDDLAFAIVDWPNDWREAISKEEIELYYKYANDYVLLDSNGLTKYAQWRASEEGKSWNEIFKEIPQRKSDLDFRICIGTQTEEVRGWYKEGAECVSNAVMQNYLLRFSAIKDTNGNFIDLHDALFWVPNISKLDNSEAKSVIAGIDTMDDNQEFINLLPRYSKEQDPLRAQRPIQSLRELKKRILAIESNIDLSELPLHIIDIMSAPGFNLSAFDLMRRRADFKGLLKGKLDEKQPFQPYKRLFAGRSLTDALQEGLGSYGQKIKGTAINPKGLFHALKKLVKGREMGDRKMQVTDLLSVVPIDLEEAVIKLLQDQKVDIGPTVEAQIHAKSDPEGWVCGNYTDCCMPFGADNNNDYMFNLSTQYFTIKYNGRIIAQSVVVDSFDEENNEDVVILDNIEVAKNYKNLTPLLANVYQTFWTEYTSRPVKVGTGYSDLIPPGSRLEQNRYKSKTPLHYSDAKGLQIYDLPKLRGIEAMDKVITFANLTERDAELIAKMEAEVYPEGMAQGKAHIAELLQSQRKLDVPGAASSFMVRQGKEPAGYLLALPEKSEINSDQIVAHIYDMAILPKFRGFSLVRKMMERMLDVASAYGIAIEAEARANTSYSLLMNERTRRWFKSKGFYLTANKKLPKYLGGEDFYFVRFDNERNTEDIA